jgi:hypothetical protein
MQIMGLLSRFKESETLGVGVGVSCIAPSSPVGSVPPKV